MHNRQLYCTTESFTAQQMVLLHGRKFCCIAKKSDLWQKLEKSSFCSRNVNPTAEIGSGRNKKVNPAAETGEKFILRQKQRISPLCNVFPQTLDSQFAHKPNQVELQLDRSKLPYSEHLGLVPQEAAQHNTQKALYTNNK